MDPVKQQKQAEANAKAAAKKAEAKAKAEAKKAEAKAKAEAKKAEAKAKAEAKKQKKAEAKAKAKAKADAAKQKKAEAKAKAAAKKLAEAEAKALAKAKAQAKAEAKEKADAEAREKAEAKAKIKAERDEKARAAAELKEQARAEAAEKVRLKADAKAQERAEAEARRVEKDRERIAVARARRAGPTDDTPSPPDSGAAVVDAGWDGDEARADARRKLCPNGLARVKASPPVPSCRRGYDDLLKSLVEALVFVSDHPLDIKELARAAKIDASAPKSWSKICSATTSGRGIRLDEVASGLRLPHQPRIRRVCRAVTCR